VGLGLAEGRGNIVKKGRRRVFKNKNYFLNMLQ
jgi:hypothetical protein